MGGWMDGRVMNEGWMFGWMDGWVINERWMLGWIAKPPVSWNYYNVIIIFYLFIYLIKVLCLT